MDKKAFGKRINKLRKENNITSHDLSAMCDVQPIFIRQIEGGTRLPSLPVFVRICNALHTSPSYFLADSLERGEQNTLDQLIGQIESMTPEQIEMVNSMIASLLEHMN